MTYLFIVVKTFFLYLTKKFKGDFTKAGSLYDVKRFNNVLKEIDYKHKIIIGGD